MSRRLFRSLAAGLGFALGATAAHAEPATPEGAKAIAAVYAGYFSQALLDKGVIRVTPDGEDYIVAWDLEKALSAAGGPADIVKAAPFSYRVTPTLDGGWVAKSSSLPTITVGPTGENGREGGTFAFDGFHLDSLFDPAAADFWRGKLGLGSLQVDMKTKSGADLQHIAVTENAITADIKVKAGEDADSVDVRMTQTADSARQLAADIGEDTQETPASELRQGAAASDSEIAGLRAKAIGELWRLLVAHVDGAAPPPEELKPKLEAVLPLWNRIAGRVGVDDVAVAFPGGGLTIKTLGEEVKLTGLVDQASAAVFLAVKDLKVDFAAAPEWAKSVWPVTLQINIAAGVDGLARAARLALDDPEVFKSGELGPETRGEIQRILTEGHPHLALSETRLTTPLAEATLEGEASFSDEGPTAHAKVTADDLDKLLAFLAGIGEEEPNARQALLVATFAKGLARQENGRLVWDIEYVAPNGVKVNGQIFNPPAP